MSTRERDVSPELEDRDDWIGQVLAERYLVEERIGQGGMGVVYRGVHRELGKPVAIKRLGLHLATEALAFERFRREAIAASRVNSPYVVQVFDWGKASDDSPFIVMELLEGQSLRTYLEAEGRLEPSTAVAIAAQILKGLHRIHQAHVLHRDLKPENVFLCDYDHERPFVKLLDFGISKGLGGTDAGPLTRDEAVIGTAAYLSPEQVLLDAPLDVRSDLYSLGTVLYEMLTGHTPFAGKTYEATLVEICTRDAEDVRLSNPLVDLRVAEVVRVALARDRNQRFESAAAFLDALKRAHPNATLERASDPGSNSDQLRTQSHEPYRDGEESRHSPEGSAPLSDESAPGEPNSEAMPSGPSTPSYVRQFLPTRSSPLWLRWLLGGALAALPLLLWSVHHRTSSGLSKSDVAEPASSTREALTAPSVPTGASQVPSLVPVTSAVLPASSDEPTDAASPPASSISEVQGSPLRTASPVHSGFGRNVSTGGTSPSVGVAGGLKLRRTMP